MARFTPPHTGTWSATVGFVTGTDVAVSGDAGAPVPGVDGLTAHFTVVASDKAAPDLRSKGRLKFVGERYRRFEGNGEYFLKVGADR